MAGGTLTERILGVALRNIQDMLKEKPDNVRRDGNGTWRATDPNSWAILARKWNDWKDPGD
eukprot:4121054-Alexandrium_andersonii.AAC.1